MEINLKLHLHQTGQLRAFSKLLSDYADEADELAKKEMERRQKEMLSQEGGAASYSIGGTFLS